MGYSFNVFSGTLDQVGSSGAVVFEGEVETFADLPEVVGDPPVGSSYLVRTSTGVWLVNRRQAGIWIRRNNTGVRATDWEYGGDYPVNSVAGKTGNVTLTNSDISGLGSAATANLNAISDADLRIVGSTDSTKKVAIEVDTNVPTNTVVTLTAPSSGGTIARTSDIPTTFAASAITSGVLNNARVNFAAPPAIGAQTPNTGAFTNLSAASRLNLPSSGDTLNDIWVSGGQVRYQSGIQVTSARTLLTAEDNLSTLTNAATARANLGLGGWATLSDGAALGTENLTISDGESPNYIQFTAGSGVFFYGNRASQFRGALGLGTSNNVTFGSIQNTPIGSTTPAAGSFSTLNATGTTELVNGGTTAGPFRLYNISSAANANFERLSLRWASNVAIIGTEKLGTGSARALQLQVDGTTRVDCQTAGHVVINGTTFWAQGGASGGNFNANNQCWISSAGVACGAESFITFHSGAYWHASGADTRIRRVSAGLLEITNTTAGTFRDLVLRALMVGGTTASFPALRNSSTTLQVRLADDSAFAPLECAGLTLNGNLTASTRNIVTDTTTGTKIGTDPLQKIGFFDKTPVVRPSAVANATDAASVITQLNALLSRMRDLGLIAT